MQAVSQAVVPLVTSELVDRSLQPAPGRVTRPGLIARRRIPDTGLIYRVEAFDHMHLTAGPAKGVAGRVPIELFNNSMGRMTVVMAKSGYWHGVGGSTGG